jgi:hypothetical protein
VDQPEFFMGNGFNVRRMALIVGFLVTAQASGQDAASVVDQYAEAAKRESPAFAGFAADRGKQFFNATHGGEWSCATCHTRDPLQPGTHVKTSKAIAPLAPAANGQRFTSLEKSDKWFRRNCNDALGRPCSAAEKGDVLTYLMSLSR